MQSFDEKITGRHGAFGSEPERRQEWEQGVARPKVPKEYVKRVDVIVLFLLDNDPISFEKPISFVTWQEKIILLVIESDSGSFCDLLPVAKRD